MTRITNSTFTRALFIAALACGVMNFIAFYPGLLHHDAWAYFSQAHEGKLNNWQPPLLGYLWLPLQAIYFGPQPMLVLFVAAYWSGFYFLARAFEPEGRALAAWVFAAGLFPMAINFTGVLVKDIAMSDCLLIGGGIAAAITTGALRKNFGLLAIMWFFLIASGFVRANALFAFPPLFDLAFAASSQRYAGMFWLKRAAMACLLALTFILGNILADRYVFPLYEHLSAIAPLQIFDTGGISYFSGIDYFQGELGADFLEKNRACYTPRHWDVYGWLGCAGSYDKLKPKFGAPLTKLWVEAIAAQPLDYLRHRIGHFNRFMQFICRDCEEMVFTGMQSTNQHLFTFTPTFLYEAIDWGAETWDASPFGKPYVWLLLCLAWAAAAFGIPDDRARSITLMLTLSGAMYALAFAVVGIASDYRYIDWTMLCALIATPVIVSRVIFRREAALALRIGPVAAICAIVLMREIVVRFLL